MSKIDVQQGTRVRLKIYRRHPKCNQPKLNTNHNSTTTINTNTSNTTRKVDNSEETSFVVKTLWNQCFLTNTDSSTNNHKHNMNDNLNNKFMLLWLLWPPLDVKQATPELHATPKQDQNNTNDQDNKEQHNKKNKQSNHLSPCVLESEKNEYVFGISQMVRQNGVVSVFLYVFYRYFSLFFRVLPFSSVFPFVVPCVFSSDSFRFFPFLWVFLFMICCSLVWHAIVVVVVLYEVVMFVVCKTPQLLGYVSLSIVACCCCLLLLLLFLHVSLFVVYVLWLLLLLFCHCLQLLLLIVVIAVVVDVVVIVVAVASPWSFTFMILVVKLCCCLVLLLF